MRRKFNTQLTWVLAAGSIALCSMGAQAQTTTTASSTAMSSTAPMAVTGTVLRYYVDRSGYVTAMDVQTTSGVQMVRFAPTLASRLTGMYPVGSTATVYVTSVNGMSYLAGTGPTMPAPTAMYEPYMVSAIDLLKAPPYTVLGAKEQVVTGDVTGYIASDSGDVLALVVDKTKLIRVPPESRQGTGDNIPEGLTPLFKNSHLVATVLPEADRYGVVSPYESRWIASAITIDGESLGAKGFGKISKKKDSLFGWNVPLGGSVSPEEAQASMWGYNTYMFPTAATTTP